MTRISPEMRAALDTRISRRVSFPVSASDVRKWALAVYWPDLPPRLFWDEDYAANSPLGGIVAPEEFNPFAWMSAEDERHPASDVVASGDVNDTDRLEQSIGIRGPGLPFQLNGGMEVAYGARMRPGDVITSENRLADYSEREGRLGLMLFTVSEDVWTNQRDEMVRRARFTLIRY